MIKILGNRAKFSLIVAALVAVLGLSPKTYSTTGIKVYSSVPNTTCVIRYSRYNATGTVKMTGVGDQGSGWPKTLCSNVGDAFSFDIACGCSCFDSCPATAKIFGKYVQYNLTNNKGVMWFNYDAASATLTKLGEDGEPGCQQYF